jgi:hypothetical protein
VLCSIAHLDGAGKSKGRAKGQGGHPEVVLGDEVSAPAVGVGRLGLAVGQEEQQQVDDDHEADEREVAQPRHPERQEHRERRLGAVSRRGEGVEAEHRHAGRDRQLLLLDLVGGERTAEDEVLQEHGGRRLRCRG